MVPGTDINAVGQQREQNQDAGGPFTHVISPQMLQLLAAGRPAIVNDYMGLMPDKDQGDQREVWKAGRPAIDLLAQFGRQYGLSESDPMFRDLANQYLATQQIYQQAGDKEGFQQYSAQFMQQVPQALSQFSQQARQQQLAQQQAEDRFARVMALQSQFAPIYSAIADKTAASNQAMYEQSLRSADNLASADPRLAEAIKVNASATRSSNDALLAAYANQIAMTPTYVADMLYRETYNAQAASQGTGQNQGISGQSQYQGLINAYQAATAQQ
jgi:hypothetical protein